MKTRIYMNHFIREDVPSEPVIAVLRGGRLAYTEGVEIYDDRGKLVARVVTGDFHGSRHQVKCYVETEARVEVLPVSPSS